MSTSELLARRRLLDEWLADYQHAHGAFSEDELRDTAAGAGVPYLPGPRADVRCSGDPGDDEAGGE